MTRSKLKIHGWYIIFILISIIICLLTIDFGDNENLVGYISFAATISSILLAVIAIIYSFYSNSLMSKSLGSLDSISKDVVKNTVEMTQATENLRMKIEEIPNFLKPIEEKADITYSKIEQLAKVSDASPTKEINKDVKINYLNITSFLGLKSIYTCFLALEKNKDFQFKSINDLATVNNESYLYGFLVASASLGLVQYTLKDTTIKVTAIDNVIKENIKSVIYKKAKDNDSKPDNTLDNWESEINAIEKFFE